MNMDRVKVNIGNRTYNCQVAKTEEEKRKGLMGVEHLPPDEGMLFMWDDEDTREMWMKDTKIPLDQIAINDDEEETNSEYKALLGSWQMSEQDGDVLVTSSFIFNAEFNLQMQQNSD